MHPHQFPYEALRLSEHSNPPPMLQSAYQVLVFFGISIYDLFNVFHKLSEEDVFILELFIVNLNEGGF